MSVQAALSTVAFDPRRPVQRQMGLAACPPARPAPGSRRATPARRPAPASASRFVSEKTKSARAYDAGRLNFKRSWRVKGPNPANEVIADNLALLQRSVDWPAIAIVSWQTSAPHGAAERGLGQAGAAAQIDHGTRQPVQSLHASRGSRSRRRDRTPSSRGFRSRRRPAAPGRRWPACAAIMSRPVETVAERISSETIGGPRRQSPDSSQRQTEGGRRDVVGGRCCGRG